ncbi:hypothetical protein F3Y22_tig00000764pilonHSYRG00275 [Hibiscus syriacus]|uniref:DUF4378 domain-containing protein n=1 Tax=Hibiscus syriacus TaxID=106335 RepID=A0A6A3D1N0_HIBSY|nr:hypothetical protein F3Y22_tig00000764pilonHSYRG00275 [Hibiscus syriacus]
METQICRSNLGALMDCFTIFFAAHALPLRTTKAFYRPSKHSVELRNVVKDCISRIRGLLVKTTKEDAGSTRLVHRTADGCKDGSLAFMPRDAHRFSYDERITQRVKVKLKDQPRLSLDSRQISIKVSTNDAKSKFLLGELNTRSQQQEPGSRKGPSSVVTKLIGLKTLPDPMQIHGSTFSDQDYNSSSLAVGAGSLSRIRTGSSPANAGNEKIETTEPPSTVMEQPSPVSVLDATFNGDESPSPVKKKSNAFKVNEILTRMNENSCKPWVSPTDSLQSIILRYLTIGSMSWTNCKREIPGVILDVERLIFKDLIGEVIRGEAEHPQG